MEFKLQLLKLGKTQVDLLHILHKQGFPNLSYAILNDYINKKRKGEQMRKVMALCENIISRWVMWYNKNGHSEVQEVK